jgi:hypothetical protein
MKGFWNSNQNFNQEDFRNKAYKTSFQILVSIKLKSTSNSNKHCAILLEL